MIRELRDSSDCVARSASCVGIIAVGRRGRLVAQVSVESVSHFHDLQREHNRSHCTPTLLRHLIDNRSFFSIVLQRYLVVATDCAV